MTVNFLEYPLVDGYIHNWLIAGPQLSSVEKSGDRLAIIKQHLAPEHGIANTPVDRDYLNNGDAPLRWGYYRCVGDHLVNASVKCKTSQLFCFLGYCQLLSPIEQKAAFILSTMGISDVWVNGQLSYHSNQFPQKPLQPCAFSADLIAGTNEIVVRVADIGIGSHAVKFAMQVTELSDLNLKIYLPTNTEQPKRQQRLERLLDYAYLEDVISHRGAHFNLRWADDLDDDLVYAFQIQDAQEAIYVDGKNDTQKSRHVDVGQEYRLHERPYWVVLKATDVEYYGQNLRYQRSLPIHVLDTAFSPTPYGSFQERQREALVDAGRREDQIFAQIARMQLGQWSQVDQKVILSVVERVKSGEFDFMIELLGLLGMAEHFGAAADFPEGILQAIGACALSVEYTADMSDEGLAIIAMACEILSGQRYPDATFTASGKTGTWHRQHGEQNAQDWLQQRGRCGFAAWDSNSEFELIIAALAHLVSFAEHEGVSQLSLALLDKIFFAMAVNSFKGAYCSTHGKTSAAMLKSAQLEATSGLMSMLWGMGVLNHHIIGTVSLACSKYEFPLFIGNIANDYSGEMLSRERHQLAQGEVNKVTYRTPDYQLSSAQDYRPGQRGQSEHIWQATFNPEAIVFVTHPACFSENEANQPGFWLGNAILPRTVQWKDVLVSVHQLPDNDWMDFTHAYFPVYSFEEYAIDGNWAFARVGDGYLALTAANGLEWVKHAPDGYRELRSPGKQNIWLCQMGRAAQDGSFADFQQKVRAMNVAWNDLSVTCSTLRGDQISFGWQVPLIVNGQQRPLRGFRHFENPYCTAEFPSESMEIAFQGTAMRLRFD